MTLRNEEGGTLRQAMPVMPISVRVPEACRLTGIGRSKLYELIAAGEIEVVKVGTMTLLPVSGLIAFIDAQRRLGTAA